MLHHPGGVAVGDVAEGDRRSPRHSVRATGLSSGAWPISTLSGSSVAKKSAHFHRASAHATTTIATAAVARSDTAATTATTVGVPFFLAVWLGEHRQSTFPRTAVIVELTGDRFEGAWYCGVPKTRITGLPGEDRCPVPRSPLLFVDSILPRGQSSRCTTSCVRARRVAKEEGGGTAHQGSTSLKVDDATYS